jgi:hypothetical protein
MYTKKATKYVVMKRRSGRLNRKYKENAHMSLIDYPISQPSLDISLIWTPVIAAEVKIYNSVQCIFSGKVCVF